MYSKTLILAAALALPSLLFSQDRIYKKNGLVVFTEVKSVSDTGIVYTDDQGAIKSILPNTVMCIRYAIGNTLPVSGAIARHYRSEALIQHPFASRTKLDLYVEPFTRSAQAGVEYFVDQDLHNSLSLRLGTGLNAGTGYFYETIQNKLLVSAEYHRYTSILKDFRFFYGVSAQLNCVRLTFEASEFNYDGPERYVYKVNQVRNRAIFGIGPVAGMQLMLGKNIGITSSVSPTILLADPIEQGLNLQFLLGASYYLSK